MHNKKSRKPSNRKGDPESIKRRNKYIREKVKTWQEFQYVKPLVCQNEACNETKLKPKETKYRVMLQCPKCKKVQTYVPNKVLQIKLEIPDVLTRNQGKYVTTAKKL
jgi:hypothetical protein